MAEDAGEGLPEVETGRVIIGGIFMVLEELMGRQGMGIEVFRPTGDVGECPIPGRANGKVFSDPGFSFRSSLYDDDFTHDSFTEGKNSHEIGVKIHSVAEVTKLLVNVECLGSHIDFYMIVAL